MAAFVYGTAAQIQIIRYLRLSGPSTRYDIADNTGLNYGLAAQCLNKLKSAGVVTVPAVAALESPAHEDDARTRRYNLDSTRAQALFDELASYLMSPTHQTADVLTAELPGQGRLGRA